MVLWWSRYLAFAFIMVTSPMFAQSGGSTQEKSGLVQSSPSSVCAERLRAFVEEIDGQLDKTNSSIPLKETMKKYFPVVGCNVEEAVAIAKSSKYFYSVDYPSDRFPLSDLVFVFRKIIPKGWGFKVSFALNPRTGNSSLPSADVDKVGPR